MNLKRVSPMLERETETELLNLAPEPWKILKCLETDIVFLETLQVMKLLKKNMLGKKLINLKSNQNKMLSH